MAQFSMSSQTNLFKINYYKRSENMYNSENVLQGRVKKRYDFTGKQRFVSVPLSFSGGVGSAYLPVSNTQTNEGAIVTSKKVYATCEIEREAMKASANDTGAFVRATAESVKRAVESYMRNASRILFGDGTGVLGNGTGAVTNVSGNGSALTPYVVTFAAAQFKDVNWEEKDFVQMVVAGTPEGGTSITNLLEVVAVNVATYAVSLVGTSTRLAALTGVGPIIATDEFVMQRSYNAEPQGLKGTLMATSGSLYGIAVQRRWKAYQKDAGGSGITPDLMNNVMLQVARTFGKAPNMIMAGYTQYQNILALLEDQKRYSIDGRNGDMKGKISFSGVEFMSATGPIGVFLDRFADEDKVYFLNDNFIEVHHRPDFGWFEEDGTVFLRKAGEDAYEARFGGYYENFITPTAHGVLHNLAK